MFNLEWYRIFLHTAQSGNFTKAAQRLHVTQPSVSYAIKQMEETLGLKLFHRLSKGVELTEEGKALLAYVEQSFSLLGAAQKHVQDLKRLKEGEIRLGASDSLIKHLLLPQLNRYHAAYPGIRIRLTHGRTPDIAQRLKEGLIDFAIVHMPLQDPELDVRELAVLEDCFVVGEAYRELAEHPIPVGRLAQLPLLLLSPGSSTRLFVERWFAARGFEAKPDIELGSVDLLTEFARLGFGAACITRSFVAEELRQGKLFELRLDEPLPPRSIGFAVRQGMPPSIAAERFAAMLIAGEA
ncbi:LysR family transcriptional regulator [Paenibacillus arenilitoris]|uniref:LysR family transcriptional regulator n=1 Tax=Paenibacillus arenilitoris TaxID=2772299 RepID=A0A927CKM8_9BACL|nr:LysR family transcriptional regulator [Paenibacillus arenilitoris]MBD2867626.1 LysR family transcriptional regulator [Paenibacillus arenilitoris]